MPDEQEFSNKQLDQMTGLMRNVFNEGFESVVSPHLDKIYDKLEEHDEKFDGINKKLDDIQETVDDHSSHLNRIERRLLSQDQRADRHDLRIKKLETSKA